MLSRLQPLLLRVVPSLLVVSLVVLTIWGDGGMLEYYDLKAVVEERKDAWAEVERDNMRLMHELKRLESDPVNLERIVAEELGWARSGATLYYFED